MKKIFVVALMLIPALSFAEDAKVDVTSFRYSESRGYSAELCGKITGDITTPAYVKVTVDADASSPGIYNVLVGAEKTFCTSVISWHGTATAALWGQVSHPLTININKL